MVPRNSGSGRCSRGCVAFVGGAGVRRVVAAIGCIRRSRTMASMAGVNDEPHQARRSLRTLAYVRAVRLEGTIE